MQHSNTIHGAIRLLLLVLAAHFSWPQSVSSQIAVESPPRAVSTGVTLVPEVLDEAVLDLRTLQARSLDDLADVVLTINPERARQYPTFEDYIRTRGTSPGGHMLEAMTVWEENAALARRGDGRRLVLIGAETPEHVRQILPEYGNIHPHHHPVDLVLVDSQGRVIERYQIKAGKGAAIQALRDPKYEGMKIVTSREAMDSILADLRKGKLPSDVQDALKAGRLADSLPSGADLQSRTRADSLATDHLDTKFRSMTSRLGKTGVFVKSGNVMIKGAGVAGKAAGPVLIVVDVGANVYLQWHDYHRWHRHEISGEFFAFKSGLRTAQTTLTVMFAANLMAPEPFLTKGAAIVTGAAAATLAVVDIASEPIYGAARERRAELLRAMERIERYTFASQALHSEMNAIANSGRVDE